jgi:hypothetical protein
VRVPCLVSVSTAGATALLILVSTPSPARDRNGVSAPRAGKDRLGFVKLGEKIADRTVMVKRRRPKFLHVRDPVWRTDIAFRVGIPTLGAVVAAGAAWLITQL